MHNNPFLYDLHPFVTAGSGPGSILCFHGWGGSYQIAQQLQKANTAETFISFNFPDHGIRPGRYIPEETSFGTIRELLPALYMLKKCVLDNNIKKLNFYGFSAGGGVLINLFKILRTTMYDSELHEIGIYESHKKLLLEALIAGYIILDTPFRSVEEITALRGTSHDLEIAQMRYTQNNFIPIDSLVYLEGLPLKIILHFQLPDEVLSNRDDALFAHTLMQYNAQGKTWVVVGNDGGHGVLHTSLWDFYKKNILI